MHTFWPIKIRAFNWPVVEKHIHMNWKRSRISLKSVTGLHLRPIVPVLLCGILVKLRSGLLVTLYNFFSCNPSPDPFLSLFSFSGSLFLDLSLSLCFLDFLDLPCSDGELLRPFDPSRLQGAEGVEPNIASVCRELAVMAVVWLSRSATAASWPSQSRPLWLESLLTSDSGSRCWERARSGSGTLDKPHESFPFEEFIFPLTGAADPLLIRCDILGFLLARGSIKSSVVLFCRTERCYRKYQQNGKPFK